MVYEIKPLVSKFPLSQLNERLPTKNEISYIDDCTEFFLTIMFSRLALNMLH